MGREKPVRMRFAALELREGDRIRDVKKGSSLISVGEPRFMESLCLCSSVVNPKDLPQHRDAEAQRIITLESQIRPYPHNSAKSLKKKLEKRVQA